MVSIDDICCVGYTERFAITFMCECGFEGVERNFKYCPNCGEEIDWGFHQDEMKRWKHWRKLLFEKEQKMTATGDIQFLKDLQQELISQETDCQAFPRFWVIGDYRIAPCPEGYQEEYYVFSNDREYGGSLDELLKYIKSALHLYGLTDDKKESFADIGCEISAIDWLKENWSEDAELVPVIEEHFICPNTMFLTKAEAKEHLELYHYNYSSKAHTYAMTAQRAPKVERLLKLLESFDFGSMQKKPTYYSAMSNNKISDAIEAFGTLKLDKSLMLVYGEDIGIAIDALKKQLPTDIEEDGAFGVCPSCQDELNSELLNEYCIRYCPNCGQNLTK